jgi:hypothetical protein
VPDVAKKHGSQFCTNKHELIHFSGTTPNFNMKVTLDLDGQWVSPKGDIRVLEVQLDLTLRWQPHIRATEAKSVHLVDALRTITGSKWGSFLQTGREVY